MSSSSSGKLKSAVKNAVQKYEMAFRTMMENDELTPEQMLAFYESISNDRDITAESIRFAAVSFYKNFTDDVKNIFIKWITQHKTALVLAFVKHNAEMSVLQWLDVLILFRDIAPGILFENNLTAIQLKQAILDKHLDNADTYGTYRTDYAEYKKAWGRFLTELLTEEKHRGFLVNLIRNELYIPPETLMTTLASNNSESITKRILEEYIAVVNSPDIQNPPKDELQDLRLSHYRVKYLIKLYKMAKNANTVNIFLYYWKHMIQKMPNEALISMYMSTFSDRLIKNHIAMVLFLESISQKKLVDVYIEKLKSLRDYETLKQLWISMAFQLYTESWFEEEYNLDLQEKILVRLLKDLDISIQDITIYEYPNQHIPIGVYTVDKMMPPNIRALIFMLKNGYRITERHVNMAVSARGIELLKTDFNEKASAIQNAYWKHHFHPKHPSQASRQKQWDIHSAITVGQTASASGVKGGRRRGGRGKQKVRT
jgi:hypothetical protein